MAEIRSVVCDMCGGTNAETYAIAKRPNTPWLVDLCDTCAQPIVGFRAHARHGQGRRTYRKYGKVPSVRP